MGVTRDVLHVLSWNIRILRYNGGPGRDLNHFTSRSVGDVGWQGALDWV